MSSMPIGSSAASGSPLNITGLASGLDTNAIVAALMAAERQPVVRMTREQQQLQGEQLQLQSIQSSLQQLAFAASEFVLPSLYEQSQAVTSSEPARVSAATTGGAGVGAHEVSVAQLASSAQRTFAFTSPASEDTITIDGHATTIKAGASAQELANAINSDSQATVYAAVVEGSTIVLSTRATGSTGSEFIKVSDPGGALVEREGTAREGKNAQYSVDGVSGSSSSNTVTSAIPGVTLTLSALTPAGPVTIDVAAPALSASAIQAKVQAFVDLYNTTIEAIQKQLTTKPLAKAQSASELATGRLFGDSQLTSLLDRMRQAMYQPLEGLPAEMSSPANIGVSTGGGTVSSQGAIEGRLQLDASALAKAVESNPAGVQKMLQSWSQSFQAMVEGESQPGGTLDARINGDSSQVSELSRQIDAMNELLAQREKALQATYAKLEKVISENQSQTAWLASQAASLSSSGL